MKKQISLRTILASNFLLVALLPVIFIGFLALHNLSNSMEKDIVCRNKLLTQTLASEVAMFLTKAETLLWQIKEIVEVKKLIPEDKINIYLASTLLNYHFFSRIKILNKSGIVLYLAPFNENIKGLNMSGQPYFQNAGKSRQIYWSDTFIFPQTGQPTIVLCLPFKEGMLVGHLNLSEMNSITDKVKIGTGGYAVITDNSGITIAHPDRAYVSQRLNLKNLEPVRLGLSGNKGPFRYNHKKSEKLASVAIISKTDWLIFVTQALKEAFAPVKNVRNIIWSGLLAAVFLAIIIAAINLKKILSPLSTLIKNTRNITKGDYNFEFDASGYFEINELKSSFKAMVDAIKIREEELKEARNFIHDIINSMPIMLIGVDHNGKITQWNRRAEKDSGINAEMAIGCYLTGVLPELSDELVKVKSAIHKKRPRKDEKIISTKKGETRFFDITVYPLTGRGMESAVILLEDVTEKLKLEEMVSQSEKMMSVTGLAAGMAHEINNPLSGIMQNTQVIKNRITNKIPANIKAAKECGTSLKAISAYMEKRNIVEMIDMIMNSGEKAAKIVNNLLSFTREGKAEAKFLDLSLLLDNTIEIAATDYDLKKKYDFKMIEIERDYDAALPEVLCESSKIQQVFLNILNNGAQAMTKFHLEGKKPRFILRTIKHGNTARIEIEDNGPGMPEKVRKRIFEPFFTTKEAGQGNGLGLSVSYFIITVKHQGQMMVESQEGKGTKLIIVLPLKV